MQLTDNIHILQIDFDILLSADKIVSRFVNVILIIGDSITLIDTGVKGSEKKIYDYIEKLGRNANDIKTIILSHSHPDHIGSAYAIKKKTHCKVLAHPLEKDWIENIELQNRERPVPGFFHLVDHPVSIDRFLEHNEIISFQDGLTLKIIKAPGHSSGQLNILFIEDKILFTADAIPLKNDIPNYSNFKELMQTLETIQRNNNYEVLLTSWTPVFSDKEEIDKLIEEGKEYMHHLDETVRECYQNSESDSLENCRQAITKLHLAPFLVNPIVDKAFRSHLA